MFDDWNFEDEEFKERLNQLAPAERLRIYRQVVMFRLDRLEEQLSDVSKRIDALEERMSSAQSELMMKQIEEFLENPDESN